jgi:hypothetical protein
MSNRKYWSSVVFVLLWFLLSGPGQAQPRQAHLFTVDEVHASAALAGEQVEIRLPFTQPAETQATVSVWLVSPQGQAGIIVTKSIVSGTKVVEATLPRPRDEKGHAVEGIEWYRVEYRVDVPSASPAHGILALGALTTNLFHISLARPSGFLTPGKPLNVRIFAGNPVTRRPTRGARVSAELEIDLPGKKDPLKLTRISGVNRSGEALFSFQIPDVVGVSATLHLEGVLRGEGIELATSTLNSEFEALTQAYISLEKDKALYVRWSSTEGAVLRPKYR